MTISNLQAIATLERKFAKSY